MKISKKYMQSLVREGKAVVDGLYNKDFKSYVVLTRYDKQGQYHYEITGNSSGARTVRKCIRRKTAARAHAAMARHIEKMLAKGWSIDQEFSGDHYLQYEVIVYFTK